jgi:mannonate dehydratase
MDRRDFVKLAGAGIAAGASAGVRDASAESLQGRAARRRGGGAGKTLMTVGTQHDSSDEVLTIMAALGVTHICSRLPSVRLDAEWSVESLTRLRERVERAGITLEMVPLPMSSNPLARAEHPNNLLGKSPERDREIDDICQMIRNASLAGIPAL